MGLAMKPKTKATETTYVESSWIGTFELSEPDRKIILDLGVSDASIKLIEEEAAAHRDLIRPHLQERPTADEIRNRLNDLQSKAVELRKTLSGLDTYSKSVLQAANLQAILLERDGIDYSGLENQLICLEVISALAVRKTSDNAGAGTRQRGQKPMPDAALVSRIAKIVGQFGITTTTDSPGSSFVKICQAISNSGGFKSNDPRGAIRNYIKGIPKGT